MVVEGVGGADWRELVPSREIVGRIVLSDMDVGVEDAV